MKPYLAIVTTIILFSSIEVAVSALPENAIDSYFLAALRFLIAGVVMVSLNLKKVFEIDKKDWLALAALGVFGIAGTFGPFHYVLHAKTPPEEVALIFSLNPIFASIAALFVLKEKLKPVQLISLLVGLVGVYIVKYGFSGFQSESLPMTLLLLWTAIAFGVYTVASKKMVMKLGARFTTGVVFLIGGATLLPFSGGNFAITELQTTIPILLYLSLGTTLIGYLCYFYGLKRLPVSVGASLFYLKPPLATLFAIIFLQREPVWHFWVGMGIIFLSMSLTIQPWRKNER